MTIIDFTRKAPKGAPMDVWEKLSSQVSEMNAVGSRVTCNPAPTDTDEDWLILSSADLKQPLTELGFTQEGSPEFYTGRSDGSFQSWRRGNINIVTTPDYHFYQKFMTATYLAKRFNLLRKVDRIALFQAVLYGVRTENLEPEPYVPYAQIPG